MNDDPVHFRSLWTFLCYNEIFKDDNGIVLNCYIIPVREFELVFVRYVDRSSCSELLNLNAEKEM